MVGDQQQQHPQPQSIPLTAEEEALKRNTDCVYFLASPLTCKKGAECEYRHSDIARVNPRDCWYWLNGNCLNPKCAFRHPPLDGLLGPQALTPSGSSLPLSQTAATPVTSAPPTSGKLGVPCIFFQKGLCLKGDRCPFFHAPSFVNSKVPNGPVAAAVSEPPTIKKPFVRPAKCSTEPRVQEANVLKPTEVPFQAKPQSKFGTAPAKDVSSIERHVRQPSALDDHPPKYRQTTPPATNGNLISRSHRMQQVHISDDHETLNSRDADEISRDPSPGFDVLVDNELRETDYYHDEDHYGRTRGQEGRSLNPNDYDIGNSTDYDSMVDVDQDMYHDARGYDSFDRMRGQYGREQRRASSERILGGSERRQYPRADSPDQIDGSDLRYHLSKQRKVNGLRSVISHDRGHDNYTGDRSYRGPSRRDSHHMPASERAVSNRLRGRIKLPGRSTSPGNESDLNPEREIERGTNWGRLSPGRLGSFTQQGRLQDRLKGKVLEDINNEGRSFRGSRMREINEDNFSFAGPKSLAELKGRKISESNKQPMSDYQQSITLGKRKYLESHQQSESDLSFEGPKPLSEILKRKKASDGNGGDMRQNEEKENVRTRAGISSFVFKEEMDLPVHSSKEAMEDSKSTDGRYLHRNVSDLQVEEGLIVDDDAMEDHEPESFGEGDGEFEYEQVEGEDYNEDEAENAEGEYVEDDDGDDFAKKIGVLFS